MTSVSGFLYVNMLILLGSSLGQEPVVRSSSLLGDNLTGNCSCGGFSTSTPEENSEPLLNQTPALVVKCNDEGAFSCKNLCLALASATKAKGPKILCARLKDVSDLKLSAFYKICERPWSYADMTAEEPLCCENSKLKVCSSAEGITTNINVELVH